MDLKRFDIIAAVVAIVAVVGTVAVRYAAPRPPANAGASISKSETAEVAQTRPAIETTTAVRTETPVQVSEAAPAPAVLSGNTMKSVVEVREIASESRIIEKTGSVTENNPQSSDNRVGSLPLFTARPKAAGPSPVAPESATRLPESTSSPAAQTIASFTPQTSLTGPVAKDATVSKPLPAFTPVSNLTGPVKASQ